jgi:hypothetical protein
MFLAEPITTKFAVWKAKGAETRHPIPALLFAVSRLPGVPAGRVTVLSLLGGLTAFYAELDAAKDAPSLSRPVRRAIKQHVFDVTRSLCWLSANQEQLCWNIKPKLHYLQHLVQQCELHNPLWLHTYQEEDLVGKVVRVARMSASGRSHLMVGETVVNKYRVFLTLVWGGFL